MIIDKVRKEIARIICPLFPQECLNCEGRCPNAWDDVRDNVDRILSIKVGDKTIKEVIEDAGRDNKSHNKG